MTIPPTGSGAHLLGGRYRLLGRMRAGGRTWRARDELLQRDVAVGEVPLPAPGPARDHVVAQVRATAGLRHPAIAATHDVIDGGDRLWLVRELVDGRPLSEVLRMEGPRPAGRVAEIGLAVLGALEAAWAAGLRHGALDADAVILTADHRTVVTGFGPLPPGVAPDELRDLGVMLATALQGHPPARPGAPLSVGGLALSDPQPPRPPSGPFGPLVAALLDDDPARRPSVEAIRVALRRAAPSQRRRRPPIPAIIAGALAVVAAVAAGIVFLRPAAPVAGPTAAPTASSGVAPLPTVFAAPPDPCKLITAEQAAELFLETTPRAGKNRCDWSAGSLQVPRSLRFMLTIQLLRYATEERARADFARFRREDEQPGVAENGLPLIPRLRPRDLPGLGHAAYTYEKTNGISYNTAVVFRVANLLVSVQYQRNTPTDPDHLGRQGGHRAARFVLDGLRRS